MKAWQIIFIVVLLKKKCIFKDTYLKMHEKKWLNSAVNTDEASRRLHVFCSVTNSDKVVNPLDYNIKIK